MLLDLLTSDTGMHHIVANIRRFQHLSDPLPSSLYLSWIL
jgi:hypothetical protein